MSLVDVLGVHLESSTGAPIVLLREHHAPHRVLPIFVGAVEATAIALAVAGQEPPRPLTHDLMAALVTTLGGAVHGVEITAVHDGTFHARLDLHGPGGDHSVDTRPSDAIALAVRFGAPVYVDDQVLDSAGTVLADDSESPTLTDAEIENEIEEFRSLLDRLEPSDFTPAEDVDDDPAEADDRGRDDA